jgi:hypothetical protein
MTCHQTQIRRANGLDSNFSDLEDRGRLHFFYHSPSSILPVRDVLNEQRHGHKTEPYIEKCAENYCDECNQANIRGFLKSSERYLFLFTTCRCEGSKNLGKVYIVGYIEKKRHELRHGGFYAVIGPLKMISFQDARSLGKSRHDNNPRQMQKKLNVRRTQQILGHFEGKKNILDRCRVEVETLKRRLPIKVRRAQAIRCK